jgi:GTP cyclohydrolase-4
MTSGQPVSLPPLDLEHDVPAQSPGVRLSVDEVSIINQRALFTVNDPLFDRAEVLCELVIGCSLVTSQRGIHMSRMESSLDKAARSTNSLPLAALLVASEIARTQNMPTAWAKLVGEVPLDNRTRVTGLPSRDLVTLGTKAFVGPHGGYLEMTLSATIITACPCMQAYALDDLLAHFLPGDDPGMAQQRVDRRALARRDVPIATHSQKGRVALTVSVPLPAWADSDSSLDRLRSVSEGLPGYGDLMQVLGASTTLTSELLKRPDEYDLVKRAHLRAQFVEDVVRETAERAARHHEMPAEGSLSVHAVSYESIHGHDIEARITAEFAALRAALDGKGNPAPDPGSAQ